VKALTIARAVVFVLLAVYLLVFAIPWSYLPLLFANVDTQAILTRAELRRAMGPLIVAAAMAITWIGLDAYLGLRLGRRPPATGAGSSPPAGAPRG